ncbi:MAG: hypothetical protein AB1758_38500, partial [Candidatus Eremiobacterota bacterium]
MAFDRTYIVHNIDGGDESTGLEEDVDVAYLTDQKVEFEQSHALQVGIYYYEFFQEVKVTEEPVADWRWKVVNDGQNPSGVYVWDEDEEEWVYQGSLGDPNTFVPGLLLDLNPLQSEWLLGTQRVWEEISMEGQSGKELVSSNEIGLYDLRALLFHNLRADPFRFDQDSDQNTTTLKADIRALPASTELYANGWQPGGDVDWRIRIKLADPDDDLQVEEFTGTEDVTGPDEDGKIAEIEQEWDGITTVEEVEGLVENQVLCEFAGLANTVGGGNTWTGPPTCDCIAGRCRCPALLLQGVLTLTIPTAQGIPPMTYDSRHAQQQAASFGFGWSSVGTARMLEQGNGDLVYRSEGRAFARWT